MPSPVEAQATVLEKYNAPQGVIASAAAHLKDKTWGSCTCASRDQAPGTHNHPCKHTLDVFLLLLTCFLAVKWIWIASENIQDAKVSCESFTPWCYLGGQLDRLIKIHRGARSVVY